MKSPIKLAYLPAYCENYYSVDAEGKVYSRLNDFTKEDLFNMINGFCYKTEIEAKAEAEFVRLSIQNYVLVQQETVRRLEAERYAKRKEKENEN